MLVAPVWPTQSLVHTAIADEYRPGSAHPTIPSTPEQGQTTAPSYQSSISWVETVSKNCQTSELSREARKILLAAWRQNTGAAHASVWYKWVSWCSQRESNPLSVSIDCFRVSYRAIEE